MPKIYTIKTKIGQEKAVFDFMSKSGIIENFKSILIPETLKGYIFIEVPEFLAPNINQELLKIPDVRGKMVGKVNISDLEEFLW